MKKMFVAVLLFIIVAFAAYVRFAPSDVTGVHQQTAPRSPGNYADIGGFVSVRSLTDAPTVVLSRLSEIALSTPRTHVLAGTADAGMITFVTRSAFWGFPDYTTASIIPVDAAANDASLLMIDGRLRFGRSDLGVNKARIETWLAALGPLTVPLDSATSDT